MFETNEEMVRAGRGCIAAALLRAHQSIPRRSPIARFTPDPSEVVARALLAAAGLVPGRREVELDAGAAAVAVPLLAVAVPVPLLAVAVSVSVSNLVRVVTRLAGVPVPRLGIAVSEGRWIGRRMAGGVVPTAGWNRKETRTAPW